MNYIELTMKTVRMTINPAVPASPAIGRIDPARVDATSEEDIAAHQATNEAESLAHGVIHPEEREPITLKPADFQAFLTALDAPAEPNAALQNAFKRHTDRVRK